MDEILPMLILYSPKRFVYAYSGRSNADLDRESPHSHDTPSNLPTEPHPKTLYDV